MYERVSSPVPEGWDPGLAVHAKTDVHRILALQRSAGNRVTRRALARTPVSDRIEPMLSYAWDDWAVTESDERRIMLRLNGDPQLSDTVRDLDKTGMLGALIDRLDEPGYHRELLRLLGTCDAGARKLVERYVEIMPVEDQLIYHLAEYGVTTGGAPFVPTPAQLAMIGGPEDPFSGVGASGINPMTLSIGAWDKGQLLAGDPATTRRFSNPIPGSLPAYLATLSSTQRTDQADLFLRRPISTPTPRATAARSHRARRSCGPRARPTGSSRPCWRASYWPSSGISRATRTPRTTSRPRA